MSQSINPSRWPTTRATTWHTTHPWPLGFNYLPSTAVNFLEMWMADTFDRDTIERELDWAANAGFNALRTNPHWLCWQYDREGLLERMDWLLATASERGIDTVFVPFDDCGFGGFEPVYGPQPEPVPEVHNSRAVASPGRAALMNRDNWPEFESYVRGIVRRFRDDSRILFWDLYNEPGNGAIFSESGLTEFDERMRDFSLALMRDCFDWARAENPTQPLTVAAWRLPPPGSDAKPFDNEIDRTAIALSDIVTFHAYCNRAQAEAIIDQLSVEGRPMISTEWMARNVDSRIDDQLALYRDRNVGCFNWGLVQGRTQTHLPWPHVRARMRDAGIPIDENTEWFHDIFLPDGTPYRESEVGTLRELSPRKM